MDGFKNSTKIKYFKDGGHVASTKKVVNKTISESADIAQDKTLVKKGISQHESFLHKGEPKTDLKLKSGGRIPKKTGTVKKYAGGSLVEKGAEVVKSLKDNILGTDEQNRVAQANLDKQAAQGSKLAKVLGGNVPAKKAGGKIAKKC